MFTFFKKIILTWSSFFKIQNLEISKKEIIFYLENNSDWLYVKSVYKKLKKNSKKIIIVSSQIENNFNDLKIDYFIGSGTARIFLFRFINTKLFITTLTDLNNFYLKRSINNVKYLYIFHSFVSTHRVYRKGAFDNYDIILCPTKYHYDEIIRTESIYKLNKKILVKYGYPRIKEIIESNLIQKKTNKETKTKILIAPSWGKTSLLNYNILKLISLLLAYNYEVHLRLHPMTYRSPPKIVNLIEQKFKKKHKFDFYFHKNIESNIIFNECDYLITEWSGIALEFAFSRLKPVFFIDTPPKVNNLFWKQVGNKCFEDLYRYKVGYVIEPEKINEIINKLNDCNKNSDKWKHKIEDFRIESVYNYNEDDKSLDKILELL